jgi:hypothetical protein
VTGGALAEVHRKLIITLAARHRLGEHLKGHTRALEELAIEMLARGLSVRDIEDAFKDELARLKEIQEATQDKTRHSRLEVSDHRRVGSGGLRSSTKCANRALGETRSLSGMLVSSLHAMEL